MAYRAIVFSPTGTTRKVVDRAVKSLGMTGRVWDITLPANRVTVPALDEGDLLLVGAPVYSGRIPSLMADYLRHLEVNGRPIILLGVYGNRAYEDALIEMQDIFEAKGGHIIGAGAFIGEHSCTPKVAHGRPDEEDLLKIDAFINAIDWQRGASEKLSIGGNRPYRERAEGMVLGVSTTEACVQCGLCARQCPVEAVSPDDGRRVDETICIRCYRCVRICPVGAKFFDERMQPVIDRLEARCMDKRLEPEWFV